jgi:hypothetical protein
MSTVRSTVWGIVVALALIVIGILAYGSCHGQP